MRKMVYMTETDLLALKALRRVWRTRSDSATIRRAIQEATDALSDRAREGIER